MGELPGAEMNYSEHSYARVRGTASTNMASCVDRVTSSAFLAALASKKEATREQMAALAAKRNRFGIRVSDLSAVSGYECSTIRGLESRWARCNGFTYKVLCTALETLIQERKGDYQWHTTRTSR